MHTLEQSVRRRHTANAALLFPLLISSLISTAQCYKRGREYKVCLKKNNNNNMSGVDRVGGGGRREKGRKLVNLELSEPHQGPYIKDDEV